MDWWTQIDVHDGHTHSPMMAHNRREEFPSCLSSCETSMENPLFFSSAAMTSGSSALQTPQKTSQQLQKVALKPNQNQGQQKIYTILSIRNENTITEPRHDFSRFGWRHHVPNRLIKCHHIRRSIFRLCLFQWSSTEAGFPGSVESRVFQPGLRCSEA